MKYTHPLTTKLWMLSQSNIVNEEQRALCIQRADALEAVLDVAPSSSEHEIKAIVGAWARARRLYSDITGEPLI